MSSYVLVGRLSTFLNDMSSDATEPVGPKIYLWHTWARGLKVCVFYMKTALLFDFYGT